MGTAVTARKSTLSPKKFAACGTTAETQVCRECGGASICANCRRRSVHRVQRRQKADRQKAVGHWINCATPTEWALLTTGRASRGRGRPWRASKCERAARPRRAGRPDGAAWARRPCFLPPCTGSCGYSEALLTLKATDAGYGRASACRCFLTWAGRTSTICSVDARIDPAVVNGAKQRAHLGWYSHLCTANGPSARVMGTHGPLDRRRQRESRRHTCWAEGSLPDMRRSLGHGAVAPTRLGEARSNCARTLDEESQSASEDLRALKRVSA